MTRKEIFSRNLNEILDTLEKSQIEVANAINVSQQTFNTWCRGVAIPRMDKIQALADYFNIQMSDLIEEKSETTPAEHIRVEKALQMYSQFEELTKEQQDSFLNYLKFLQSQ